MPYLIDGHNLIPKVPGLSLQSIDDEMQLVALLQEFCRLQRKEASVYFDNAPPGQPQSGKFGLVTAYFIRSGMTADQAIRNRLRRLGREAPNWTVISSDRAVQEAARMARAQVVPSEAFSRLLVQTLHTSSAVRGKNLRAGRQQTGQPEAPLSSTEVDEWLRIFSEGKDEP